MSKQRDVSDVSDKILDRIKKLLALGTNNPNEHEAAIAMRRAHALLAEYNLSMESLTASEREESGPYIKESKHWKQMKGNAAARTISNSIAKLYFCKMFFTGRGNAGDDHTFVGRKTNVQISISISETVIPTAFRTSEIRKRRAPRIRNGFYERGETKMDEGTANLPALRNTYLAEIAGAESFLANEGIRLKTKASGTRNPGFSEGDAAGRAAGDKVSLRPGIGRSSQKALR